MNNPQLLTSYKTLPYASLLMATIGLSDSICPKLVFNVSKLSLLFLFKRLGDLYKFEK